MDFTSCLERLFFSQELGVPPNQMLVVAPGAEVVEIFWNADIVALATDLHTDKKCCLDILSKEQGQCFYKANGANLPNGELPAGIGCVCFCWFQRINLTKG